MEDCFNLNKIDKSLLELIGVGSEISDICREYLQNFNSESAEKIVEKFEEMEKKLLKVKKNVVRMIEVMEDSKNATSDVYLSEEDLTVKESENG